MRMAVINGTAVENIIEASPGFAIAGRALVEATDDAHIGGTYDGVFTPPEPDPAPAPTAADVDAERDRRIEAGFIFDGVHYQSRADDRENIAGASTAALGALMAGAQPGDLRWHGGESDFVWIAEDNTTVAMDAQTVFAFGQAAMAHKQAHIFAARALKDEDPIPADFADDIYWP